MPEIKENGLYNIAPKYFIDFPDPNWLDHKNGCRPYYYAIKDNDGILWLIPLSTQVENYRSKLEREEMKYGKGNCVYYFLGEVLGREQVFLISDMFPISSEYITKPFIVASTPVIIRNSNLVYSVRVKALKFLKLVSDKKIKSKYDIMGIKRALIKRAI